jgi:hypothetical protein
MSCSTCKKWTGRTLVHEICPLAASMLCKRCLQRGHLTEACTEGRTEWERPSYIEELIPYDVRQRWGLTSMTPITFPLPRGAAGTEKEIASINTIVIPEEYTDLKEFIKEHKIKVEKVTKESKSDCIKAIKAWASTRGYRAIMEHTIQTCSAE